jgi:hypothetical protein
MEPSYRWVWGMQRKYSLARGGRKKKGEKRGGRQVEIEIWYMSKGTLGDLPLRGTRNHNPELLCYLQTLNSCSAP